MEGAGATGLSPGSWAGMSQGAPREGAEPNAQPSSRSLGEDAQPHGGAAAASVPFPSARCPSRAGRGARARMQHPVPEQSAWTVPVPSPSSAPLLKAPGVSASRPRGADSS